MIPSIIFRAVTAGAEHWFLLVSNPVLLLSMVIAIFLSTCSASVPSISSPLHISSFLIYPSQSTATNCSGFFMSFMVQYYRETRKPGLLLLSAAGLPLRHITTDSEAIDKPFGKRSCIRKVNTRAQTKNIVAIFRFNQKIIFRQN